MAGTSGHGGSLTLANLTVGVKAWTLDTEEEQLDVTDFDSSGLKEYVGGLKGWSASVDVNWSATNTIAVGATGTCTFDYNGVTTISGTVRVASIGGTTDVGGIITQSITLQGTGALPA